MKKKLTLRLLTVLMTIMTTVAFMPTAADTVWAQDSTSPPEVEVVPDDGQQDEESLPFSFKPYIIREDTNGDGRDEYVFDVSQGPIGDNTTDNISIRIDGDSVDYYYYTKATDGSIVVEDVSMPELGDKWYEKHEIIITGTTKEHTFYKNNETGNIYPDKPADYNAADYTEITSGPYSVEIVGKTHYVTFEDLNMSQADTTKPYRPVFLSGSSPTTTITLSGDNKISGNYASAIYVPDNGNLTIKEESKKPGALVASANSSPAAAIGGYGRSSGSFGKITIESGTINATGYDSGAGIGGSGAGAGDIIIKGGNITATGGDSESSSSNNGAPGIGSGANSDKGSVTITGGNVAAIGGKGSNNATAHGISVGTLSTEGNTIVLSSTNGITASNADDFNAIVWTDIDPKEKKNATAYGNVLLSNGNGTGYTNPEDPGKGVSYQQVNLGACNLTISEDATVTAYPIEDDGFGYYSFETGAAGSDGATVSGPGQLIGHFHNYIHDNDFPPTTVASLRSGYKHSNGSEKDQHDYIDVIGLDEGTCKTYSGKAYTVKDLISIEDYDEAGNLLDTYDWNMTITNTTTNKAAKENEIIDAGVYRIVFSHSLGFYDEFVINGAKILQKPLSKNMINMSRSFGYGDTIEYTVSDSASGKPLIEGLKGDYTVTFHTYEEKEHEEILGNEKLTINDPDNPLDAGTYAAVFTATNTGNYTTKDNDNDGKPDDLIVPFTIQPANIENAKVEIYGSNSFVYNGEPQDVSEMKVTLLNGKEISSSDYTVAYKNSSVKSDVADDPAHITDAGQVTVTVTPTNPNYTNIAITHFDIAKRSVEVASAVAAYPDGDKMVPRRQYDGTKLVKIVDAELVEGQSYSGKHVIESDIGNVEISVEGLEEDPTDDLTGTVDSADAGTYKTATLSNVRLTGTRASNYTVSESKVTLSRPEGYTEAFEGFEITKLPVPTPRIEVSSKSSAGDKEKFLCTVKVTNAPNDAAMYQYGISEKEGDIDNIKWQNTNEFDKLTSNTTYWFYCKVDEVSDKAKKNTYPDPQPAQIAYAKYKTPLIPQDPPDEFELEIALDPNGETYTVTIPIQEGAQYSFDGKNYSKSNVLKRVGANETVTGYARFPATKTHAISEPVSATDVTPPLTVKTPVISPENGAFYGSVKVEISCGTAGATIYYTTDGNYPVAGRDPIYTSPITVTEDTTISAIAVKDDMEESEMASVDYVYTEFPPTSKSNVTKGVKVTNDLKNSPSFSQKDSITAALSRAITEDGGGYTYQNIAYYDLQIQLCFDGTDKNFVKANADNFPEEGVEITVPVPKDTSTATHEFRVAHMFSETSDRLGITAGEIEKPEPTENGEGLTFTVTGCSPLAIGWVETEDDSAAGDESEGENKDEDEDEDADATAGENADTLNAEGQTGSADGDAENAAGDADADGTNGAGGADADGAGADGENADDEEDADGQGGAGGVVDELVNAVTTGDYTNPYFWAAVAIVSLLLIIIIAAATRRRRA